MAAKQCNTLPFLFLKKINPLMHFLCGMSKVSCTSPQTKLWKWTISFSNLLCFSHTLPQLQTPKHVCKCLQRSSVRMLINPKSICPHGFQEILIILLNQSNLNQQLPFNTRTRDLASSPLTIHLLVFLESLLIVWFLLFSLTDL